MFQLWKKKTLRLRLLLKLQKKSKDNKTTEKAKKTQEKKNQVVLKAVAA